ncbi:MAG: hypothetical protein Q9190_000148 [Brigantiaea leucoxantha]
MIPRTPPPPELLPEVSYLIAGGLSGICGELAKFMIRTLKVKNLIVISRSGLSRPEAKILYDSLQGHGTRLAVLECDISVKNLLSQKIVDLGFPPVRGIIQGAMVLRDSIFENMTLDQYHSALRAKHIGTRNLYELYSQRGQLDFFIMLSSCGGVIGAPSQTNYAAANTYQDALAVHRRSQGLPGTAIALGTPNKGARGGGRRNDHQQIQELIKVAITDGDNKPNRSVIDRSQVTFGPSTHLPEEPRFSSVRAYRSVQDENSGFDKQQQLGQRSFYSLMQDVTDSIKLKTIIVDALRAKLSRMLLQPVEKIKPEDTLSALGVDSLVAVEVRNWLKKEAGTEVSVFDVLSRNGTVGIIADIIVKEKFDLKS